MQCPSQGLYLVPYRHPVWPAVICVLTLPCLSHTHRLTDKNKPGTRITYLLKGYRRWCTNRTVFRLIGVPGTVAGKREQRHRFQEPKKMNRAAATPPVPFWELNSLHLTCAYGCLHNVHLSSLISFICAGGFSQCLFSHLCLQHRPVVSGDGVSLRAVRLEWWGDREGSLCTQLLPWRSNQDQSTMATHNITGRLLVETTCTGFILFAGCRWVFMAPLYNAHLSVSCPHMQACFRRCQGVQIL